MKLIPLTQGKSAKVDDEDFDWLSQYLWYYVDYCDRAVRDEMFLGKKFRIFMHNAIAEKHGLVFSPELDHKDRDGINNQKENFRSATRSQQAMNQGVRVDSKTGYRGVSWHKKAGKWRAYIFQGGKQIHLGMFVEKVDAAKAYDREAIRVFGEFAVLNFPETK